MVFKDLVEAFGLCFVSEAGWKKRLAYFSLVTRDGVVNLLWCVVVEVICLSLEFSVSCHIFGAFGNREEESKSRGTYLHGSSSALHPSHTFHDFPVSAIESEKVSINYLCTDTEGRKRTCCYEKDS